MAKTYKPLLGDDIVTTRTLLHEAIPITGTISSGTYQDNNIKTFSHGIFESVYDYPYLSSSANHIFDLTFGINSTLYESYTAAMGSDFIQGEKKRNIYNQMAQVLFGYDISGSVRNFESDGIVDGDRIMNSCFFINYSRLLSKDEIKKGSYVMSFYNDSVNKDIAPAPANHQGVQTIGDYGAATEYRTCPAGDYGILYTSSLPAGTEYPAGSGVGLVFYQAGIVVLTSSRKQDAAPGAGDPGVLWSGGMSFGQQGTTNVDFWTGSYGLLNATKSGSIEKITAGLRNRLIDIDFNNTIELNSAIYFCRVNHNEYNYSSNPTYVSGSKIVVKNNVADLPVTYITSIGLYSPDNELLATAKLSEPIRKDPNTELTLRVRLDY